MWAYACHISAEFEKSRFPFFSFLLRDSINKSGLGRVHHFRPTVRLCGTGLVRTFSFSFWFYSSSGTSKKQTSASSNRISRVHFWTATSVNGFHAQLSPPQLQVWCCGAFCAAQRMKCATVAAASFTMSLFRHLAPRTHQPHRSGYEVKGNVLISCLVCYTLTVNKKRNKKSSQTWTDNLLLHLSHQANKLLTEKIILTLKVTTATVTLWSYLLFLRPKIKI